MDENMWVIVLTALLPVLILLFYIWRKDRISPEPPGQMVKGFFYGMISAPLSMCISIPFGEIGLYPDEIVDFAGGVQTAFFAAAIPEEAAKLFMLWLLVRKNKYFDEKMDGIVYAVCVSLGFAALENILYLFESNENFISVGVSRALFSIPGHFVFGVLMGYYYSLAKFYPKWRIKNGILVYVAPVLAHGIYDGILMVADVSEGLSGVLTLVFLFFCHRMWKYANKRINKHLDRDAGNLL